MKIELYKKIVIHMYKTIYLVGDIYQRTVD